VSNVTIEILFIFALLVANGVFAMAEIAVVSARKARLQQRAEQGDRRAREALELARDPDEFLSTVQIGITLVGIMAGAFGGATITDELAAVIARVPALAHSSQAIAFVIVVAVITYFSLVVGELVPKRLGLNNPERVASIVARPMRLLSVIMTPVVWLLTASTDLVMRLLRVRPSEEPAVTEDEIRVMIEQGAELGVLSTAESEVAQSVFRLGERRAGTLMTPRTEIVWLDVEDDWDAVCDTIRQSRHSRFPLCRGRLDDVAGIVETKSLVGCGLNAAAYDLQSVARPPMFVPETLPAVELLDVFHASGLNLAMVVDEFGGVQGLVTLHDVLAAVVGDITEPGAGSEPAQATRRADGSWLLDGMLPASDFRDLFKLDSLPGADESTYETLAGFVIMLLGSIPQVADQAEWGGFRFEIMDMDGRRIDKVLVVPPAGAETGE
jgi:putative hemolysin